jgi:hypothetical protein
MGLLKLSDSEVDIVMRAAQPLDVADRDGFLRDVAAALAALPECGDGAVFRVVREIQRRHFDVPDLTPGPQIGTRRKFASTA